MTDDFDAQVDAELANLVAAGFTELSIDELDELLNRMSERAVRHGLRSAIYRLRGLSKTMRVTAERDGWRAIATVLLGVLGLPISDIPPVEIIELRETKSLPAKNVAALEQWWADLTRRYEEKRANRNVVTVTSSNPGIVRIESLSDAIAAFGAGSEGAQAAGAIFPPPRPKRPLGITNRQRQKRQKRNRRRNGRR